MMKLNQVIAVEKGVKSRAYSELTEFHKVCQKPDLFSGFSKAYRKRDDESEDLPPEQKKVQFRVDDILKKVATTLTELMDITAAKDHGNTNAKANLSVNGALPLLTGVPVTYLLFLEKQLTDLRTFIEKLPELDEIDDWDRDQATGLYKTEPVETHRTKKLQKPIVLYPATPEHPAQTQLITEDVLVGYWETVKHNGGIPKPRKDKMFERADALLKAIKFAREEANEAEALPQVVGQKIFDYLFSD